MDYVKAAVTLIVSTIAAITIVGSVDMLTDDEVPERTQILLLENHIDTLERQLKDTEISYADVIDSYRQCLIREQSAQ